METFCTAYSSMIALCSNAAILSLHTMLKYRLVAEIIKSWKGGVNF